MDAETKRAILDLATRTQAAFDSQHRSLTNLNEELNQLKKLFKETISATADLVGEVYENFDNLGKSNCGLTGAVMALTEVVTRCNLIFEDDLMELLEKCHGIANAAYKAKKSPIDFKRIAEQN
jgi:methyl-accepting chemotaxis protein